MSAVSESDIIGSQEAADILGWSGPKFRTAVKTGGVPYIQQLPGGTGAYLFSRSAIEQIARQNAESAS